MQSNQQGLLDADGVADGANAHGDQGHGDGPPTIIGARLYVGHTDVFTEIEHEGQLSGAISTVLGDLCEEEQIELVGASLEASEVENEDGDKGQDKGDSEDKEDVIKRCSLVQADALHDARGGLDIQDL